MGIPQEGDIGTKVRYNAQESLADQTMLKLMFKKPDGATGAWDAIVHSDTYAEYETQDAADLQKGETAIQIYIETPSWKGHSTIKVFEVGANL